MTWDSEIAACQPVALIRGLYQGYGPLGDGYGTRVIAELGRYVLFDAMARRLGQLVLALLPYGAVLANTPADEALKPCGEAYYYPSKVRHSRICLNLYSRFQVYLL
jgi:hypothetical protein